MNIPIQSYDYETNENVTKELFDLYQLIKEKTLQARNHFPMQTKDGEVSRDNLLAYAALREYDIHELQNHLAAEGLSSLGRLESHVFSHMEKVLGHLGIGEMEPMDIYLPNWIEASKLSAKRAAHVLGTTVHDRSTNIMVTLDVSMLDTPEMIEELLLHGMDIARINCAHDTKKEWKLLIQMLRRAEEKLHNEGLYGDQICKIYMDLGGPKIRINQFQKEIRPLKISILKDMFGNKKSVVEGYIDLHAAHTDKLYDKTDAAKFVLAVSSKSSFKSLRIGEELHFIDTRGRKRSLRVMEIINPTKIRVLTEKSCYISDEMKITTPSGNIFKVRDFVPKPVQISVQKGDLLYLYRDPVKLGHPASEQGPAGVAAMLPEALKNVQIGDRIFIDDGKIGGIVIHTNEERVELEIISPVIKAGKVKEEKGLNFPDTLLDLPALTEQDLEDLQFVTGHADTVGLSFVHSPQDLEDLHGALEKLNRTDLAVVAKIETAEAIHNLSRILLAGLNFDSFGIMIARGDLAVEVGFENMSIVQEDILCMCDAAHVPVIWATQVLESLAKQGVPARAEITDAAMGHRAECVMLNKGPHIIDAVRVLSKLLTTEARHHVKKRQVFTAFTNQQGLFE